MARMHSHEVEQSSDDFKPLVTELRRVFNSGKTKDVAWRRQQLQQIKKMCEENHEEITAATRADLGGPKIRGIGEVGGPHKAADIALDKLDEWTAAQAVPTPFEVSPSRMGRSYVRQEAKGVILIIGPWNFPFELLLHPMASAIAAGNCVVVKPSEIAQHSAATVERLVAKYMDPECVRVVQGAAATTTALLQEAWDHIFYTGNGDVARIVLKAAAEHLTPVTLELGGKSPVVIDRSAKIDTAVKRITAAKWFNTGQVCVAPDYVLVHRDREQEFVEGMKREVASQFGADPKQSPDFGRIINSRHVERIGGLLEKTRGKVIGDGMAAVDPDASYVPPTLVQGAAMGEPLLTEEIFGPVLPIVAVDSMADAVDKIRAIDDSPLALYVYSEDKVATAAVLDNVNSGGVAINDSLNHLLNPNLPFGGVGSSGYGSYHGKTGFDVFTHKRAVLHSDTTIIKGPALPPAPYSDKLYDLAVKATVTGFLTEAQRKTAKALGGVGLAAAAGLVLRSRL